MTKTTRPTLCTLLWILAIIWAIFGVIALLALGWLSIFASWLWVSFAIVVGLILLLVWIILSIATAIGFFGMKKWLPILVIVSLGINLIQYITSALAEGGSFSSGLISLAISVAIVWYVYANKKLFKN